MPKMPAMPPMPPSAPGPMTGDAMNLGSPMSAPPIPPLNDALASIKSKLGEGRKSLPGVGFKKPVSKVAKKAISGMRGLKRKMAKKAKK